MAIVGSYKTPSQLTSSQPRTEFAIENLEFSHESARWLENRTKEMCHSLLRLPFFFLQVRMAYQEPFSVFRNYITHVGHHKLHYSYYHGPGAILYLFPEDTDRPGLPGLKLAT